MEDRLEECEALNEEASMPMVDLIAKYKQKCECNDSPNVRCILDCEPHD